MRRIDDVSDLGLMNQRMSKNVDVVGKAFEQSDDETSRLFVLNLSSPCTRDEELADIFKSFGNIFLGEFFCHFFIRPGHYFRPKHPR